VFDEIEKAHPEAHNMLLQIMEEGHLTDARGRKVDFSNTLIVMTSNVGADMIKRQTSVGFALQRDDELDERLAYQDMHKKLTESLKRVFRPEFINRLDSVVVFRSLSKANILEIVSLELDKVANRLEEHDLTLTATPEAIELLADMGYDPDMGARPLRRVIQQKIEDRLSDAMLSGQFKNGDTIVIDVEVLEDETEIVLSSQNKEDDEHPTEEMIEAV
jgi:ATP-dependent Clp protease ATP-binding subunit ClpC